MQPDNVHRTAPTSAIELMIDKVIIEVLELDSQSNNQSGKQMLEELVNFFNRPAPASKYSSLRDFLQYRHKDAAVL
jgi:hypothetical protein